MAKKHESGLYIKSIRVDGKRQYVYGKTLKEANAKIDQIKSDIRDGRDVGAPTQLVPAYLQHWLHSQAKLRVAASTFASYDLNVRRISPYFAKRKLEALRPAHVQAAIGAMLEDGHSPATVRQAYGVLRVALRDAAKQRLTGRPATEGVTPPKVQRADIRPFTPEQVTAVLAAEPRPDLLPLWLLLATTGMRSGEACGLKWSDVDLPARVLHVRRGLRRKKGEGLVEIDVKTEKSRRRIDVSPSLVAALEQIQWRQEASRRKLGAEWVESGYVFVTDFGKPRDPSAVWDSFQRTLDRAGLPRRRVHELRHTAATILLTDGVHPKVVQELLGHSTIAQTLDTYSAVVPALSRHVAERMDELVRLPEIPSEDAR